MGQTTIKSNNIHQTRRLTLWQLIIEDPIEKKGLKRIWRTSSEHMLRFLLFWVCGFAAFYFNWCYVQRWSEDWNLSFVLLKTFEIDLVIFWLSLCGVRLCIPCSVLKWRRVWKLSENSTRLLLGERVFVFKQILLEIAVIFRIERARWWPRCLHVRCDRNFHIAPYCMLLWWSL